MHVQQAGIKATGVLVYPPGNMGPVMISHGQSKDLPNLLFFNFHLHIQRSGLQIMSRANKFNVNLNTYDAPHALQLSEIVSISHCKVRHMICYRRPGPNFLAPSHTQRISCPRPKTLALLYAGHWL